MAHPLELAKGLQGELKRVRKTVLEAIDKYGQDTPEFKKWRDSPKIWAADEVKAYSAEIKHLEQSLRILQRSR